MKYVQIRDLCLDVILEASNIVSNGGLVVYPTDTLYGLGVDPFNADAVELAYIVKRRESKPMPILVSSFDVAFKIGLFNSLARRLAEAFWPGALTIVVPKIIDLPEKLTMGLNTIGLRMPNHPLTLKLLDYCGGCLTGTSANISGMAPPKTAPEALSQLGLSVDYYIDFGPCPLKEPSTVVDLSGRTIRIVRLGTIKMEDIKSFLND
ncbi:MAG: L-threonylcarbamoyladenylate synthase [Candidatus Methanomethylicia archaeon]